MKNKGLEEGAALLYVPPDKGEKEIKRATRRLLIEYTRIVEGQARTVPEKMVLFFPPYMEKTVEKFKEEFLAQGLEVIPTPVDFLWGDIKARSLSLRAVKNKYTLYIFFTGNKEAFENFFKKSFFGDAIRVAGEDFLVSIFN